MAGQHWQDQTRGYQETSIPSGKHGHEMRDDVHRRRTGGHSLCVNRSFLWAYPPFGEQLGPALKIDGVHAGFEGLRNKRNIETGFKISQAG
ncbi:hypothetical protein MJO29_015442 [Puccinia striiformis f. sp. tritici]|nr:hypothetical protein Pst134EB_029718 [Puccinia striiformis f. sp. tritici]KAI7936139.1 hypothetical protein MJO29_015442 [Puccinia striiformis f. sp. tritici]KAI9617244.1 hypothetical protein H4Q26_013110 [Puccinia striiformis f. sp. tritici PST-130]